MHEAISSDCTSVGLLASHKRASARPCFSTCENEDSASASAVVHEAESWQGRGATIIHREGICNIPSYRVRNIEIIRFGKGRI